MEFAKYIGVNTEVLRKKGGVGIIQKLNTSPLRHGSKIFFTLLKGRKFSSRFKKTLELSYSPAETAAIASLNVRGVTKISNIVCPELTKELLHFAHTIEKNKLFNQPDTQNHKKFWTRITDPLMESGELNSDHILVRFAIQPALMRLASGYLGSIPFVSQILLLESLENSKPYSISQLWHLDRDEVKMVKFFIYLSDVESSLDGPFTVLGKADSALVPNSFFPRHIQDPIVLNAAPNGITEMLGPAGTSFVVDTSKCYHMGSRVAENHRRLLYSALYVGLPSVHPWAEKNWIPFGKTPLNDLQQMMLRV